EAALNVGRVLGEVVEAHSARLLLRGVARAVLGTALAVALVLGVQWLRRRVAARFTRWVGARLIRPLQQHGAADVWRGAEARIVIGLRALGRLGVSVIWLVLAYEWLTFLLRQFPYTRPWGEALRGLLIATFAKLGESALAAVPGLLTVVII